MASSTETAEIAGSLMIDEIPVKLRCAACDKLAVNAFRMPCCDQSICEECQACLPSACPVCLHEPVDRDDCRPNKALRTTIKVFLKKKGVEREGMRKKEVLAHAIAAASTPVTPTIQDTPILEPSLPLVVSTSESQSVAIDSTLGSRDVSQILKPLTSSDKVLNTSGVDVPKPSIETLEPPKSPGHALSQVAGNANLLQETTGSRQNTTHQTAAEAENIALPQNSLSNIHDPNLSFDLNGSFPNMTNMNVGDLNPMMQFMQNGVPNNMMGQFSNIMGLPGMGMDPMAISQGMFGNYGGPGMGMNGMNMGMGFDAGQNAYGGFNGQTQAFNQSHYNGHANGMGGSFAASSNYGGNNMPQHQGSFNQMHQHQNFNNDFHHGYHSQGLYNRGRGRGRGAFFNAGRGRGYAFQSHQGRHAIHEKAVQNQLPEQTKRRGSPVYTPMQGPESDKQPAPVVDKEISGKIDGETTHRDEEHFDKELESGRAEESMEMLKSPSEEVKAEVSEAQWTSEKVSSEQQPEADSVSMEENKPRPVQSVVSDQTVDAIVPDEVNGGLAHATMPPPTVPAIPTGPSRSINGISLPTTSPRGRGFGRGFMRGFSDHRSTPRGRGSVPPSDISANNYSNSPSDPPAQVSSTSWGLGVEGAPTGPKALRKGATHAGVRRPQDSGFSIMGRANAQAFQNGTIKSPSATAPLSRSRSHSRSRSRSQSRHRSPVHHHSSSHHHDSRQSVSPERDAKRDKRRERHDRYSRKDDESYEESQEYSGSRARGVSSHSSPEPSAHRSLRNHVKDSFRSKHRSHRSYRNRTRSPEEQMRSSRKRSRTPELRISGASKRAHNDNQDEEEDERRSSHKRRHRDDDGRDYDRKRSRRSKDHAVDEHEQSYRRKYNRGEERSSHKEQKSREKLDDTMVEPPRSPKVDEHALEREARNRERQIKEIQRRAVMEGKTSGSRGKTNGRVGERRASYKYEDEDLTSRVEKERESDRWG